MNKFIKSLFLIITFFSFNVLAEKPLYVVKEGKVDAATEKGFKTWRSAACDRCHGNNQQGMVGPSLIDSLKVLTYDEFKTVLLVGRVEKGMPGHPHLEKKLPGLYAYLKGRSDGKIPKGRVRSFEKK
jgi:hypothetical protein